MSRPPLTVDESGLVAQACQCYPNGLIPHPRHLPDAERLLTRGLLVRRIDDDGEPNYFASERLRGHAALLAAIGGTLPSAN